MGVLNNIFKSLFKTPDPGATYNAPIPPVTPQMPQNNNVNSADIENHKVAGVTHYKEAILSLGVLNDEYKLNKSQLIAEDLCNYKIYEYDFYTNKTELIPEPTNPNDPKAIKVVIDDVHVGYIKAGSCSHILKLINEDRIDKITSEIYGGKYKKLVYEEDYNELVKETTQYGIKITIYKK